jgi:hypothetical protein
MENRRTRLIFRVGVFMQHFIVPIAVQVCLMFGLAGLFWPEKLMPIFEVLMFPWTANHRMIRANSVAALVMSVVLFASLLSGLR